MLDHPIVLNLQSIYWCLHQNLKKNNNILLSLKVFLVAPVFSFILFLPIKRMKSPLYQQPIGPSTWQQIINFVLQTKQSTSIIFRLYSNKWLPVQVAGTWICGFLFLVPTSLSLWGHFGLDPSIGSCTILPDNHGRSSKEFLFVFAFLSPCLAIIVCYARWFIS